MKIAYLVDYDINLNSGVIQKILQQGNEWRQKGHIVFFVSLKTMSIYDHNRQILFREKPFKIKLGRLGTALNLLYDSFFAFKLLKRIDIDIIYMRYRFYMPFFNKITKTYKVVMEINSDDTHEYKLHSKLTHFYNKFTRSIFLKNIYGFIAVSNELKNKFAYLKKKIDVIANGINVKEYKVNFIKNKNPVFVFIGTPNQPWHGLDKIEKMANHFDDCQFYIIGTDGMDTDNIKYFGYLSNQEATKIIQKSDIGIGPLSLYKYSLTEASPLKTRHYLACGLPIIYSYLDTDLGDEQFALRLENKENNLDYFKIKNFVDTVFGNVDIKKKVQNFALNVLDYSVKEDKRLDFFKTILDDK